MTFLAVFPYFDLTGKFYGQVLQEKLYLYPDIIASLKHIVKFLPSKHVTARNSSASGFPVTKFVVISKLMIGVAPPDIQEIHRSTDQMGPVQKPL